MRGFSLTLSVVGMACCFTGAIWIFQGVGVLGGSFMSDQPFWAWMGVVTLLGGLGFLAAGRRTWRRS